MGQDSDVPTSLGEIGHCGVAVDSLADMETLFEGIPLDQVTTSMTINSPAAILLAMYLVVAEKQGVSWNQVGGTLQNDILKEFIAQKEFIFPLAFAGELVPIFPPKAESANQRGLHARHGGSGSWCLISTRELQLVAPLAPSFEKIVLLIMNVPADHRQRSMTKGLL
jgi:methylmalonyl-CoA mutase, N-terminal domain